MKTEQLGYYKLPNGMMMHFSINAWYELEKDTGLSPQQFLQEFGEESGREEPNEFILLDLVTDYVYAACKAYDLEEGNEITYNRYKIRDILVTLDGKQLRDLNNSMFSSSTVETSLGKRMVAK